MTQLVPVQAMDRARRHRRSTWGGLRLLVIAIVLSVLLPWLVIYALLGQVYQYSGVIDTVVAGYGAVIVGHYFVQRIVIYPGSRATAYLLPVFSASFGAASLLLFFLRLEYGRVHLVISFLTCVLCYYAHQVLVARERPRLLGVVPIGKAEHLEPQRGVEWQTIRRPDGFVADLDGVVADFRADLSDDWERFLADQALAGIPVFHVKQVLESLTGRVDIEHLSENNLSSLLPGLGYLKIKQWLDIAAAVVAVVVLMPALLAVALAIRLDSPGPALFRQTRMGYRGDPFTCLKFRTMVHRVVDDTHRGEAITLAHDVRITRLGRLLRRTRIDELPQLLNILRGEMSWIGPRPEAVVLSDWYETEIPFYRYRHIVRPGVSGWAQVNQGHVAKIDDVTMKLQYDFYYIKYFSPWLDVLITARTIRTMLTGYGAL